MKKRIRAFLLAFVMLFTTVAATLGDVSVFKADQLVIKLHYNRPDGNYENWSVWFWPKNGSGTDHPFAEENGEMVSTFTVPAGTTEVGYIVKLGDWQQKDWGEDQFIDVAAYVSGTIDVYVESGVKGETVKPGSDVKMGTKITGATYDMDKKEVTVTIVNPKEGVEEAIILSNKNGEVAIDSVTGKLDGIKGTYTLKLKDALDLAQSYQVAYEEETFSVTMPNWYSTDEFESKYTYTGDDLGSTWTKDATTFRVWAPTAEAVSVLIYSSGSPSIVNITKKIEMTPDVNGTWVAKADGDWNGNYYVYEVTVDGQKVKANDPYAKSTGVNGERAMIIDMDSTDPEGWDKDTNPNADLTINDAIIYELHIRDLGSDESSGIKNVGKFLSLTEHGTTTPNGVKTGIDHIKDLGITHLHILPMYDYGSVNEMGTGNQFNWGYDPKNYNVPEGSYSTDPKDGAVRVNEAKQMVQSLHKDGISVVMDVVYNHVYDAGSFCFNQIVPGYFSRISDSGTYSNGSGCGNDTASERSMVKKYIVDSVLYWVEEYHIDGFRFDLVGLIDTVTINEIMEEVHKVRPDVIFYGEGWTMTTNVTKDGYDMTTQTNSELVPGFAFFNDTIRDGIKGSVFQETGKGYVQGAAGNAPKIERCFYGLDNWCKTPAQTINYASCHDNNTLWDRLQASRTDASQEDLIKMNNLAAAIYMLSQGTPFIHAGEEMLRTKVNADGSFNHNSYNSTDEVNSLKWDTLENDTYMDVVNYYKGLIAFRKEHAALRMTTAEDVNAHITTMENTPNEVKGFVITGGMEGEKADAICVIFNPNPEAAKITLPEGNWNIYINGEDAGTTKLGTASGEITVDAISAVVLVQEPGFNPIIIVAIIAIIAVAGVALVVVKKKKTA